MLSKKIEERFGDYIDVDVEPDQGLTGRFEVRLTKANATCVKPMLLMDKSTSYLHGHGQCSNGRFDLLGTRDIEVNAIEEALDDVVINSVVDGSLSEHAKSVRDAQP